MKKFKYKDFESEIELDFTEGQVLAQPTNVPQAQNGATSNGVNQQDSQKLMFNLKKMRSNHQWSEHSFYKIVKN